MGLLEEEWSGAGVADKVLDKEEGGDGGHHPEHQELLQEVKKEEDDEVSSDDFGPLKIGVLENNRWNNFLIIITNQ